MVEEFGPFVEVYVSASLEECAKRDPKGLYEQALAGKIPHFTGVSDPYEPPESPEIALETASEAPESSARRVLESLDELELVETAVAA
jgi:adenylylsulfate kinase